MKRAATVNGWASASVAPCGTLIGGRLVRRRSSDRGLLHGDDLDEVPAGVVENRHHGGSDVDWSLDKSHALSAKPLVLGVDIVDGERGGRDAVIDERLLVRPYGRMTIRFKQQLRPIAISR